MSFVLIRDSGWAPGRGWPLKVTSRSLEFTSPTPILGEERGAKNGLIVRSNPQKSPNSMGLEHFQVAEHMRVLGGWRPPPPAPGPDVHLFPLVYTFTVNQSSSSQVFPKVL